MTKTVSAKKTVKVSGPITEQYICFAAPTGWNVSNIKDSNNFDVTGSITIQSITTASSEQNGLVEANDVKEYVTSMFQWVDFV